MAGEPRRAEAERLFKFKLDSRASDWHRTEEVAVYGKAREVLEAPGKTLRDLRTPLDAGLDVTLEWHETCALTSVEGDDLKVVIRLDITGERDQLQVATTAFPVGQCRRCDGKVPVGCPPPWRA